MIFRLTSSSCSSLCRNSGSSRGAVRREAALGVGRREAVAEGEPTEADSDAAIG